ncbi:MAG: hypothetical protein ACJ0J2_01980 [Dehalococcoidia bacterium]
MEEIDQHFEKMSSNKEVGKKISELNSYCDMYVNSVSEILKDLRLGLYLDNMKKNKYVIQYWMKPKTGKRWDLADAVMRKC